MGTKVRIRDKVFLGLCRADIGSSPPEHVGSRVHHVVESLRNQGVVGHFYFEARDNVLDVTVTGGEVNREHGVLSRVTYTYQVDELTPAMAAAWEVMNS